MKMIKVIIIGTFFMTAFILTPSFAYADWRQACAAKLKKAEERLESSGESAVESIRSHLFVAKEALEKGERKECFKNVNMANGIMEHKGM